jgi:hypothetical protein
MPVHETLNLHLQLLGLKKMIIRIDLLQPIS